MASKIKKLVWKENSSGNPVAFCGDVKVAWITKSLSNNKILYPCLFKDMFVLKKKEYTDMNEAKEAIESAFNQIVSKFIED